MRHDEPHNEQLRQLDGLLRGEISAAETYRMAIDKIEDSDSPEVLASVDLLRQMEEDHGRAAQSIRERIREFGGDPSDTAGLWGLWAQGVQGTMNLFGDSSALKSLKEGEEHGLKQYQDAIDAVDVGMAEMIEQEFIPAQHRHINLLDQLIRQTDQA